MTDPADLRSALTDVESEIERLRAEDEQIAADLNPANGPADAGDVAALTTAREENGALRAALEARRDTLTQQLG